MRVGLPVVLAALAALSPAALAARLETQSGLGLEISDAGRVTAVSIGPVALPMVAPGGLAIADLCEQPAPANLVPNPGFEEGVTGWHLAKGQSLDTGVARSGRASARLEVPGPEPGQSNLEVQVAVKPGTRYRVGLWLRRENVGVCGAYVSERDERGKLSGQRTQVGVTVPKRDGVWLPLAWEITTEPETRRLSLRANIYRSTGTLWLDDFSVEEISEGVYDPLEGQTSPAGGRVELKAALPHRGLAVDATWRADKQCLRIDGQVRDTTGRDRAVAVKFALPLDLAGWTWHHDAEQREAIQPGPPCRRTYACRTGIGVCSVYPWASVSGPRAGLSLALPLSQGPRVFLLQHDQARQETSLVFFFGLCKDAKNHPSRAPFSFVLYAHDPAWGMRSTMETYYRLFAESFRKRPAFEGYLNYANMERFDPATHELVVSSRDRLDDASDFGEGYKFLWHLHGCYDFRQVACDDPTRPDDRAVFSLLGAMIAAEQSHARGYTPTAETMKKIVFGPEGEISYIGDTRYWRAREGYNHTDKPGWGFNFRVNEDPGISPFLADVSRRKAEEYSRDPQRRDWDATFTADAIEGYMANRGGPDYRREHFRTTLVPLAFGRENLRPCLLNTIWDFHHKAWGPITQQHKIVTYGNANGYEQFFTMPYVDVPMTEGSWDPQNRGRLDRFLRAVNYQKIWRYWHAWDKAGRYGDRDPANVQAHFRAGLASGVYPAVACVQSASGDLEPHRALYRQYVPAIEELSRAGWEPVPYARATDGVVVERFGRQGDLHFTLRNYADHAIQTVLTPDWTSLGLENEEDLVAIDILPRQPRLVAFPRQGLRVTLEPDGSAAFWVGTRAGAVQHGLELARASLAKIERLFRSENIATALGFTPGSGLEEFEAAQQIARELPNKLKTGAPIDLAKLLMRFRAEVSLAVAASMGLQSESPRVVADAVGGESVTVPWRFAGKGKIVGLKLGVVSPWPEIAARCETCDGQARLWIPADPPRRLLPFLLEARGKADGQAFTVATPVDVAVGRPLDVKLLPAEVPRGRKSSLTVTVANRLAQAGRVTIGFALPAGAVIEPGELELELGTHQTVDRPLTLDLTEKVPLGDLRITYTTSAENPRFTTKGPLFLTVQPD